MFTIDHIMIESMNPEKDATEILEKFSLPLAWPYTKSEDYDSIGINFGNLNIELINFRKRFGIAVNSRNEFSGVAFQSDCKGKVLMSYLESKGYNFRIGEDVPAHTTVTIDDKSFNPTIFVVEYHFDTSGWKKRLIDEFTRCGGGKYLIDSCERLIVKNQNYNLSEFDFIEQKNNEDRFQLVIKTNCEFKERITLLDLIPNFEIQFV